nr:HD domain-containing protein [Kineococcus siccus]
MEHSLGVLALVAHFRDDDDAGRAAALLHDIGHLPFSHTAEGVRGLDHHHLGIERLATLAPLLDRYGLDVRQVADRLRRAGNGPLASAHGMLTLDHLDSFVRSGHRQGRLRVSGHEVLSRSRLRGGAVSTDADTADELGRLVVAEARSQLSPANVLATGLLRHWTELVLRGAAPQEVSRAAAATDDELWTLLRTDERTRHDVERFRRDPARWDVGGGRPGTTAYTTFRVRRLYLTLPHVEGEDASAQEATRAARTFGHLPVPPLDHVISWQDPDGTPWTGPSNLQIGGTA